MIEEEECLEAKKITQEYECEQLNIFDVSDSVVYIVIDQDMHSYEAILGIYDSFEKAMNCNVWSNRGIKPNERGEGDSLFIYKEELNKELQNKF